jgi:hypothetical protein
VSELTKKMDNFDSVDQRSTLTYSSPTMREKSGDFEIQFNDFLTADFLSPEGASAMQDAVNFLKSRVDSDKTSAAALLQRDAENSMKNPDETSTLQYVLRNIGLIAVASDACHRKEADRLMTTVDYMITDLVENSQKTALSISNLFLSNNALNCLRQGFKVMIEGGQNRGYWHSRLSTKIYLISDLKILILSEMVLFDGNSYFFKSLLGSKWIERAARLSKETDPKEVVRLTYILITDERWCNFNGESYLKAIINMALLWADEQPLSMWDRMSVNSDLMRVKSHCTTAKNILLTLFCGEGTEMILFNLSNVNFARTTRAVFSHLCQKMVKKSVVEDTSKTVGEFGIELERLYFEHKRFNNEGMRCQDIIHCIFEQILFHLFSRRSFDTNAVWGAVCGLQDLVQGHRDSSADRFFMVSCNEFLNCVLWIRL